MHGFYASVLEGFGVYLLSPLLYFLVGFHACSRILNIKLTNKFVSLEDPQTPQPLN